MKKRNKLLLCATAFAAIVIGFFAILFFISEKQANISLLPIHNYSVNYNNYANTNYYDSTEMDFYNDHLYYTDNRPLFSNLKKADDDKASVIVRGKTTSFQIYGDSVFYIQNQKLFKAGLDGKNRRLIKKGVDNFIAFNDDIFIKHTEGDAYNLTLYNAVNEDEMLVFKGVRWFGVYGNDIIFTSDFNDRLYKYSVSNQAFTDMGSFTRGYNEIYLSGDYLILLQGIGGIQAYNIKTRKTKWLFSSDSLFIPKIICNDQYLFVAYKEVEYDMFGAYKTKRSGRNGLYKVDIKTTESSKIDNDIYSKLFLFGDYVFGISEQTNEIYQISFDGKTKNNIVHKGK